MSKKSAFYVGVLLIITVIVNVTYFSYGFFVNKSEQHGKLNIMVGNLNYRIVSDDLVNNSILVSSNMAKKITINVTSLNEVNSKYELYYTTNNSNIEVGYYYNTVNMPTGNINSSENRNITIVIRNNTNTSAQITFGVQGGLISNNLVLESGRRHINTEMDAVYVAGLYDSNNNLLKNWNELEAIGLTKSAIEQDYVPGRTVDNTPRIVFENNNLEGKLVLPTTIAKIGNYAFYGTTNLTGIIIPESVISIGDFSFSSSTNLASILVEDGLISIGASAFESTAINTFVMPDTVTSFGNGAFIWCSSLTDIKLSNSLSVIPSYSFQYSNSLSTVEIPNSVTSIGNGAFSWMTSLTNIVIPSSIVSIGSSAFSHSTNLSSVEFMNPNGWVVTFNSNTETLNSVGVADPSRAAIYLLNDYALYSWTRLN